MMLKAVSTMSNVNFLNEHISSLLILMCLQISFILYIFVCPKENNRMT